MHCWHCEEQARGVCQFCGRALCKDHAKALPSIVAVYKADSGTHKAVVVGEALWCGVCKPKDDPVELPELD